MTVRIYVSCNVFIIVNITEELIPRIEKIYTFDIEFRYESLYDILVTYNQGRMIIRYSDEELLCNEQDFDFNFIMAVENIAVKKSSDIIYHGSAIIYDNKYAIAFMGYSGSGKTTIVDNLESYSSKFKRISDDLLIVFGTQLYKNYLPTKVRIENDGNDKNFKSIKPPTLFDLTSKDELFDLSLVVSVNFCSSNSNSFVRLDTFNSMKTLISNSRSAPNNFSLMQNITGIINSIPIYSLKYHDGNYAIECLFDILNMR